MSNLSLSKHNSIHSIFIHNLNKTFKTLNIEVFSSICPWNSTYYPIMQWEICNWAFSTPTNVI